MKFYYVMYIYTHARFTYVRIVYICRLLVNIFVLRKTNSLNICLVVEHILTYFEMIKMLGSRGLVLSPKGHIGVPLAIPKVLWDPPGIPGTSLGVQAWDPLVPDPSLPPHQSLYRIGSRICFMVFFMPIYRMVQNVIPYVLACICCKASCEATPCVCAAPSRNA